MRRCASENPQVSGKPLFDKHLGSVLADLVVFIGAPPSSKDGSNQDKNRKSDHKSTSDESKPSTSSLRADRRKRHKKTRLRSLFKLNSEPTAAKAKALERRLPFLQPSFWVSRRLMPSSAFVLGRSWARTTA